MDGDFEGHIAAACGVKAEQGFSNQFATDPATAGDGYDSNILDRPMHGPVTESLDGP
jgi:hypothetical protein